MSEMSRRDLFGLAKRAAIGVGAGVALVPADLAVEAATEELTGRPTGNPAYDSWVEEDCKQEGIPAEDCEAEHELSVGQKLDVVVEGPFKEEFWFRALPSAFNDVVEREMRPGQESDSPADVLAFGSERSRFTRGEIIIGTLSSLLFGAGHNATRNGFDKKNIPISQTMGGFALWGLQRRFGFLSNLAAHMTGNFIGINWPKTGKKQSK